LKFLQWVPGRFFEIITLLSFVGNATTPYVVASGSRGPCIDNLSGSRHRYRPS
jgi:hypothetical protein